MKQPSKFKRWFLGLFGGVPKSDYDLVVEQRDNFVGDLKINDSQIKSLKQENELLKKQIAHDPMAPVVIRTQNVKLKKIQKVTPIGPLPLDQTEFCLRDAVLAEVSPFIKTEYKLSNQTVTATLLLAEVEECV
nr:MAG TPA: hypothetical protein [Caudoviricetes sp.]